MPVDPDLARRVVEATPDAVVVADGRGVIRLWNSGAERLFGYTAEEALGQTLDLIIPEKQRQRHWEGYDRVMESGETRYGQGDLLAVPATRKDGTRVSLEFTIALLRDDSGAMLGPAAILRDVTERFQRDRALRERITALEAQLKAPGQTA